MIEEMDCFELFEVKEKFCYGCCGRWRHLMLVEVLVVEEMMRWDLSLES